MLPPPPPPPPLPSEDFGNEIDRIRERERENISEVHLVSFSPLSTLKYASLFCTPDKISFSSSVTLAEREN